MTTMNYEDRLLALLEQWITNSGGEVSDLVEVNWRDRSLALLDILSQLVLPGNPTLLDGHNSAYYLNRSNHTGTMPMSLVRAGIQPIPTGSDTLVSFSEVYDTASLFAGGSPTIMSLPAGTYLIGGHILWPGIDAAEYRAHIVVNGSAAHGDTKTFGDVVAAAWQQFVPPQPVVLGSAGTISLLARQNTGSPINLAADGLGDRSTTLWALKAF